MKRYIFNIQYNKSDKTYDKIYLDAYSRSDAYNRLSKQFPGVFKKTFVMSYKDFCDEALLTKPF